MRLKNLVTTFGLAAIVGIGAGVGVGVAKESRAFEVSAESQRIYLDISGFKGWGDSSAVFKLKTHNNAQGNHWWSTTKYDDNIYYADVDLKTYAEGNGYEFARFASNGTDLWNEAPWHTYANGVTTYCYITGWTAGEWSNNHERSWTVVGASSGTWESESQDINIPLTKKMDKDGLQFYSTTVTLAKGSVFKVKDDAASATYYGSNKFDTNDLTKNYLDIDKTSDKNITVSEGGTFEIYVKPNIASVWIQVNSVTEATTFANTFLTETGKICDGATGHGDALAAIWNKGASTDLLEDKWDALTVGAKAKFAAGTDNETLTNAKARYVYLMNTYSGVLNEFTDGPSYSGAGASSFLASENNNTMVIFVVSISAVALLGAGIFVFSRKRKHQ